MINGKGTRDAYNDVFVDGRQLTDPVYWYDEAEKTVKVRGHLVPPGSKVRIDFEPIGF